MVNMLGYKHKCMDRKYIDTSNDNMETKKTIVFNRIIGLDSDIESIARVFESKKYTENAGVGFTYVHIEDDVILTKVLIRTPSYLQNYNSQENIIEKKIVNVYEEIELLMDFQYGLIYSTSSSTKFSKAKSLLRNCFNSKVVFKNVDCSPEKVFERIQLLNWEAFITDLSIKKFVYKEGAIGRLSIHLEDSQVGKELIDRYSGSISRLTVSIESKVFSEFFLSVASQNSFTIRCQESNFWPIFDAIRGKL
ncbi:hypothetical protein N425_05460 [Tannerella sp. oral taxon BU063 isolate Cell 2]|uniref:Uncharacterized protein n=1 Tax=Tannerella sp. oral taxon BU063 isolate Cell 2 TaxID=1411148 RepID=W2C725_9BACT|nr:hypothetical protein N425_05460 [Tannerella sp. oral taxon BU063 isolate Cell 2]